MIRKENYAQVNLLKNGKQKVVLVHRLIGDAFLKNPQLKKQINHKDGNGLNNRMENLEWVTPSENGLHSYRVLGNQTWLEGKKGEMHPCSKSVLQKTKEGKLVRLWKALRDAERIGGFNSGSISRCCNKEYKTHRGYVWEFAT